MHRQPLPCLVVSVLVASSILLATSAAAEPAEGAKDEVPKLATDGAAAESITAEPVVSKPEPPRACDCPAKAAPPHMPIFVADWGHLTELTRSDPVVFARAELMERRQRGASLLANLGIGVGLGMIGLGTVDRVAAGEWRKGMDWFALAGAAVAVLSAVSAWNYAPDHGELVDAVNLWNRRHPDKLMAP